ncbi:hypothetical protein CEQ21_07385 (plasmid) [Niallia circulans]|uniref:Uncharacterized protein n=1 Tax=Niallia circulans TaxID=1397 RepID=A0A553SQX3_NIACI|nr:hypothetical protein [Niallia circulans]TRZ39376.1 hypothetical protein CEQ21_07385 [Niallia circulans]
MEDNHRTIVEKKSYKRGYITLLTLVLIIVAFVFLLITFTKIMLQIVLSLFVLALLVFIGYKAIIYIINFGFFVIKSFAGIAAFLLILGLILWVVT